MPNLNITISSNPNNYQPDAIRDLLTTLAEYLIDGDFTEDEPRPTHRTYDPTDTIKAACARFADEVEHNGVPAGYTVSTDDMKVITTLADCTESVEPALTLAMRWAHEHPESNRYWF